MRKGNYILKSDIASDWQILTETVEIRRDDSVEFRESNVIEKLAGLHDSKDCSVVCIVFLYVFVFRGRLSIMRLHKR